MVVESDGSAVVGVHMSDALCVSHSAVCRYDDAAMMGAVRRRLAVESDAVVADVDEVGV